MKSIFVSISQDIEFLLKHEAPTFKNKESKEKLKSIQKRIQLISNLLSVVEKKNDTPAVDKKLNDISLNEFMDMLEETMNESADASTNITNTVAVPSKLSGVEEKSSKLNNTKPSQTAHKLTKIQLQPVS